MSVPLIVAAVILLVHLVVVTEIIAGVRRMGWLGDDVPEVLPETPLVSVIVPACNEEKTIESGLRSLLAQSYPRLEIIVVNDRSTDATGPLLARLQQEVPASFTVITITELPDGWLGKAHALQTGATRARGEILLFTDADIEMEPTTITRAVHRMTAARLDHLCLMFQQVGGNWLVNGMILDAASGLLALFKPWRAETSSGRWFMGVGAFNMVRAAVYRALGGHRQLAMHPIDDLMLGRLIKEQGFHQQCLLGQPFVSVCWYRTGREMVTGLMKNIFSLFHYQWPLALLTMGLVVLLSVAPFLGYFAGEGLVRLLSGATLGLRFAMLLAGAKLTGMGVSATGGGLLAPFLSLYIIGRGTWTTLRHGGINWRTTFYPLAALRASRPLLWQVEKLLVFLGWWSK